jgi:RNA polymerase sigma-70 factor (family 1)
MSLYQSASDQHLLSSIIDGNEQAYAELYDRYHDILLGYVYSKLASREEAEDVVHDVMVKIWTNRERLTNVQSIRAYLFTSVRNKAFDIFAHNKMNDQYMQTIEDGLRTYSQPSDYLVREKDLDTYIKKQVSSLAPKMREVFELSRYSYMSNSEIADFLGISKNTVETQIKRALKVLKYKLTTFLSILLFLC